MSTSGLFRPKSAMCTVARYNPILPSEQPIVIEKGGKAQVSQSFYYSKYPEERPKGKNKAELSKNNEGTFNIGKDEDLQHRPSIRVNIPQAPHDYSRPQSIRVDGYDQSRNKRNFERPPSKPRGNASPSPMLQYENERKYCLPSDIGIRSKSTLKSSSKVFDPSQECYLFNGKFKNLLSKPTEIRQVLGYEYALPYRDQKVTSKP